MIGASLFCYFPRRVCLPYEVMSVTYVTVAKLQMPIMLRQQLPSEAVQLTIRRLTVICAVPIVHRQQ